MDSLNLNKPKKHIFSFSSSEWNGKQVKYYTGIYLLVALFFFVAFLFVLFRLTSLK